MQRSLLSHFLTRFAATDIAPSLSLGHLVVCQTTTRHKKVSCLSPIFSKKFCPQNRLKNFCIPLIQYNLDNIYLIEGALVSNLFDLFFKSIPIKSNPNPNTKTIKTLFFKIQITETSLCLSYRNETNVIHISFKEVKIHKYFL